MQTYGRWQSENIGRSDRQSAQYGYRPRHSLASRRRWATDLGAHRTDLKQVLSRSHEQQARRLRGAVLRQVQTHIGTEGNCHTHSWQGIWGEQFMQARILTAGFLVLVIGGLLPLASLAADMQPGVDQRFAQSNVGEIPDFQRHVVPLLGRLGCSGRACHGSFQGRGGFQLSLFGYDFAADHEAISDEGNGRVDLADPDESLIIAKPTNEDEHEGGERYALGSWEHHLLHKWIEGGRKYNRKQRHTLSHLEVIPSEIIYQREGVQQKLQVVAHWQDGTREDVTALCRFQTNDDEVAQVDSSGTVTAGRTGDTHVVVYYDIGVQPVPVLFPVSDFIAGDYPQVPTPTTIDRLVIEKLSKLGITPSEICTDSEFLRRLSLDMTGTLPTPTEIKTFLADNQPDKRQRKIDELLATPAYAAWWTTRLCDYTGNNDAQLTNAIPMANGQASRDWYDWIYRRVVENVPYDELVTGILTAQSREPGQDYLQYCQSMSRLYSDSNDQEFADRDSMPHYWARREFRDPEARAIGVAYTFLGIRIQCAQCHKHPFDQWTKDDFAQFQQFFSSVVASNRPRRQEQTQYATLVKELGLNDKNGGQMRREIQKLLRAGETVPFPEVYVVKATSASGKARQRSRVPTEAKIPGGPLLDLTELDDPRVALMDWMRAEDNPYFARAFVNRVWANYFGIGVVNPPDDMSLGNPPSNKRLLDYLANEFIASGFDMKWLHREITSSRTYQLSWIPNETNVGDRRNFSHAIARRLPAEVVYDALQQATAAGNDLTDVRQEIGGRAIATPGTGGRGGRDAGASLCIDGFRTLHS